MLLAAVFSASLAVAVGYYLGPIWGGGAGVAAMAVAAGIFASAGTTIVVRPDMLLVGRAQIDHRFVGRAVALDSAATRLRAGTEADARAHLVLRPYVATAVEITLDDAADPVPYWLLSSRHPVELAAARDAARAAPDPAA